MSDIQDAISSLRKRYEQSYGFAVFDLEAEEKADRIVVRGKVLTRGQKAEAVSEMEKIAGKQGKEMEEDIRVLSDPASGEIGWAAVSAAVADQKSRFVSNKIINERIRKRIGASQLKKGDVIRVLCVKEDQLLGQSGDLTLGWTDLGDVEMKDGALRERWPAGTFAKSGELLFAEEPAEKIIAQAEKFLGVRYALGAKSEEAIDCSGFTQSVYKGALDIMLPKHSWDQKKMGVPVDFSEAETGDLVFLINKQKGTKHVGIWEKPGNIIHASSLAGRVVRQNAEEAFGNYEAVEIRRIVGKK